MRKIILSLLLACSGCLAQSQAVNQILGPPPANWVSLYWCGTGGTACGTGNTNVTYICYAPAVTATPTVYTVGGTPGLTSIAVSSNVGTITFPVTAQLWVGQIIAVAGSATTALNASYRVSAVSGSTATITTSGVANATYTDMTLSTSAPVLNAAVWSIQVFTYTNSSVNAGYFGGPPSFQVSQGLACSNRTNY